MQVPSDFLRQLAARALGDASGIVCVGKTLNLLWSRVYRQGVQTLLERSGYHPGVLTRGAGIGPRGDPAGCCRLVALNAAGRAGRPLHWASAPAGLVRCVLHI